MTIYHHDPDPSNNPEPPTTAALITIAREIERVGYSRGLFADPANVMGVIIKPSPEIYGGGSADVTVAYSDGHEANFLVDMHGFVHEPTTAFSFAGIIEIPTRDVPTDELELEELKEAMLSAIGMSMGAIQPDTHASVQYVSTPKETIHHPNDDYAVQPVDERMIRALDSYLRNDEGKGAIRLIEAVEIITAMAEGRTVNVKGV